MSVKKAQSLVPPIAHNCVISFSKNIRPSAKCTTSYQDFVKQFSQKHKGKYSGPDLIRAAAAAWNKRK